MNRLNRPLPLPPLLSFAPVASMSEASVSSTVDTADTADEERLSQILPKSPKGSKGKEANRTANELANVMATIASPMADLNQAMNKVLLSAHPIPSVEIGRYVVAMGGKRLRPVLTFLSAMVALSTLPRLNPAHGRHDHLGRSHANPSVANPDVPPHEWTSPPHVTGLAACVELIHAASLLHDDVLDEAFERRGQPCAHISYGVSGAILTGDYILSRVYQWILGTLDLESLQAMSNVVVLLASGELRSLLGLGSLEHRRNSYEWVVHAKTAALFEFACHLGAHGLIWSHQQHGHHGHRQPLAPDPTSSAPHGSVLHGAKLEDANAHEVISVLRTYGACLGRAFQYIDDCLDYVPNISDETHRVAKTPYRDYQNGIATLPVFASMEGNNPDVRAFWMKAFPDVANLSANLSLNKDFPRPSVEEAQKVLATSGAWGRCAVEIRQQLDTARQALASISLQGGNGSLEVSRWSLAALHEILEACWKSVPIQDFNKWS